MLIVFGDIRLKSLLSQISYGQMISVLFFVFYSLYQFQKYRQISFRCLEKMHDPLSKDVAG